MEKMMSGDKELKNIYNIYAGGIKSTLRLKPLLSRPELFYENDNKVSITEDDLAFDLELQEFFKKIEEEYRKRLEERGLADYEEYVLSKFNPFRVNNLSKIVYAAIAFADIPVINPRIGQFGTGADKEPLRILGIKFAKSFMSDGEYKTFNDLVIKCEKILADKKNMELPLKPDEIEDVFILGDITNNLIDAIE